MLAACAEAPTRHSSEYFPESKYGKASPRVASASEPIERGGGRYQLGDPYQVAGTWYYPSEDKNYSKVGRASWYGSAFHGRLTANGEVYDMNALTAASPTLPLPCYARVTNLTNGSSVIVRVNDRGPFARGRIIDLSSRAARMLAYKDSGTAKVKVDYVGPAPLEGNDQPYLLASYSPGSGDGIGQPSSGVMLAMNGPTPISREARSEARAPTSYQLASLAPIPVSGGHSSSAATAAAAIEEIAPVRVVAPGDPSLPHIGPILSDRPEGLLAYASQNGFDVTHVGSIHGLINSYADEPARESRAATAIENALDAQRIASAWLDSHADPSSASEPSGDYVNLGLFTDEQRASRITAALSGFGAIRTERILTGSATLLALTIVPGEGVDEDTLLKAAWNAGADSAFTVRASDR